MSVQSHDRTHDTGYVLPTLAAFAAAGIGGLVWALIVKYTQYEIGFVAWGIGLLAGIAALTAARGVRALPLQATAVVAALAGIVLGKYLSYLMWGDSNGYSFSAMWSWWDALWIGLAVVTAWRVTGEEDDDQPAATP